MIDTHVLDQVICANAVLRVYPEKKAAYLIAIRDIRFEEEILWNYGPSYKYSEHIRNPSIVKFWML